MARPSKYSPAVKAAFIKAALQTRAAGGKFAEAYKASMAAGYKGTPGGLYQLLLKAKGGGMPAKRGPGRPKGSGRRGRPAGTSNVVRVSNFPSIQSAIEAEVATRVNAAVAEAIASLKALL